MTAAPTTKTSQHDHRKHPEWIAGALLLALGATTMLGWLTHSRRMVDLAHGLVPMVFNTGASFFLCGVALSLPSESIVGRRGRQAIGVALVVLVVATFLERWLGVDLGVNLSSLQVWYDQGNTRPGGMAPNTALAFLLIGVALLLPANVASRISAISHVALTFAVMAIGLVGLVSYFLAPDLLFGWANSTRMAIHTATGVIIASTGLWVTWSRAEWYSGERFFHEGEKIRLLSAAVAVVITITAGLTGFVLLQSNFESALEGRLTGIVKMRGPWLQALATGIARSSENAAEATGLPLLGTKLAPAEGAVDLSEAARKLLRNGIRSVTFKDGAGNVLARFGRRSEQAVFDAPLDATGDLTLIWDQELRIRSRHRLDSSVARMSLAAESVVLESEARQIAPLLFDVEGLGRTAEVSACQAHGDTLICLPNVRHEVPFTAPMKSPPMRPLPIQLAMDGAAPGVMHAVDYRGHDVIAAYGTLSPKIGFVAKQDTVEAYAPIRAALMVGVPVLLLLALAGAFAMYSQVNPLLRRMRRSEVDTAAALAKNVAVRNAVSEGILTLDGTGRIESSNVAALSMLGYGAGQLDGLEFFALLPARECVQHEADFNAVFSGVEADMLHLHNLELQGLRSDGTEFPLELTLNIIPEPSGRLFVAVIRDITARKVTEETLARMAKFDALTGLPNRALFQDRLHTSVTRATRSRRAMALMFLDLDGFKGVNDRFGHSTGDELLKQVALRLSAQVRKSDTVARLGGDEFTIILEQLTAPGDAEQVARKAVDAMQSVFLVDGHELCVTASVGMVLYDPRIDGDVDVAELLRQADQSMYDVKRRGKNGFAVATGTVSQSGHAARNAP